MVHPGVGLLFAAVLALAGLVYIQPAASSGEVPPADAAPLAEQSIYEPTAEPRTASGHEDLLPKFLYQVQPGDTLSGIARRFGSRVPWIVALNPPIRSPHLIRAGQILVVPVDFPLPGGVTPKGIQVLPGRFLGSYGVAVPFADIQDFMLAYGAALEGHGFDVSVNTTNPVDGITVRQRGVVLGRISFSAGDAEGLSRMDIGLLFTDDGEAGGEGGEAGAAAGKPRAASPGQRLRVGSRTVAFTPAPD